MIKTQEIKDKIVDVALDLAATMSWDSVGFIDIAGAADLELAQVFECFDDKGEILQAYEKRIQRTVEEAVGVMGASESCRDRLFDVLMERFETLNTNRAGLLSVLRSFEADPKQAVIAMPYLGQAMTRILELSGIETTGVRGALRVAGLGGVYLKVLHVWRQDESADLSRVMAALDKDLGCAEAVMNFISL